MLNRITLPVLSASAMIGLALLTQSAFASATQGKLYLDGKVVGTVVNSSPVQNGLDPLYAVTNGESGQLGIAGVGPGDSGYHGGRWAVYLVTFTVSPYLLTSDEAVFAAEGAGDVTVTRAPDKDFRCPVTQQNN